MLSRPQLIQDIQATAVWVLMALRSLYNRARMFVPRLWFLTHTGVRQGDNLDKSHDAGVAEWHEELNQHQWAQRLTCTSEPDTLPAHAVPLAAGGYADDLARTSIAGSYRRSIDINQLTTSSLATALGRRALQLHPKNLFTRLMLQRQTFHSGLAGAWSLLRDTWGAQRTIEGTMTTERAQSQ